MWTSKNEGSREGCECFYLDYNADEVSKILDTIVATEASGGELYGETAEAIIDGDITIATIRDLRETFSIRLGQLNIFPQDYHYASRRNEDIYQIDEHSLVTAITAEAVKRDRQYKAASAQTTLAPWQLSCDLGRGLLKAAYQLAGIYSSRTIRSYK
jgi:hypothetical protein